MEKQNILFKEMSIMYFFIEFFIPWIMKWSIEVSSNPDGFPCLQRIFYTKFWNKLLQKNNDGKIHGQEIIDSITQAIDRMQTQLQMSSPT